MAEKVVSVRLQAQVQGFVSGMSKAKASVDDLTKAAAPSKADAFGKLADKAAVAGLGVATAVGVAVKRFADFDQAMSAVQANSGATGAALESLRAAAIKMGADSQFSASEAAQGINEMAKAGVATADILGGGLKGAMDLAAAGQISVADAAETAATAMTVFKLSGDKIPHVADLLANAANKAQGGVGDMSQALKQAGLVASGMGLSIEETTAGLTAFASAGLLGSDAGTSFKTMLQRLNAPTGEAKNLMDDLNISAYDSAGNFVGLANVAEQLKTSMEKMTPAQRAAAMSVIFGSDAVRAANVLYEQGADGINKWTKEVSEQGAAAKQAATLTDNLKGDIERLGGALDSVFINTGSGANGSLRGLTQGVTAFVNVVGEVPGPVLLAGGALTALALGLPRGIIAWRAYQAQLTSVGLSMDAIALKSARTATALNALGGAVAVVGVAAVGEALIKVQAAAGVASVNVDALAQSLDQLNRGGQLSGGVADLFRESKGGLFGSDEKFVSTGEAIKRFSDIANDALGDDFYHKIVRLQDLGEGGAKFDKTIGQMDAALAQLVQSGHADQAAAALKTITSGIKDQGVVDEVTGKLTGYKDALKNIAPAAEDAVQPQSAMAAQLDKIDQSADDAKKALDNLRSAIEGLGSPLAAQRAAERDFQQAIDDSADRLKKRAELEKELADTKAKPATSGRDNGPADANADGKISAAEARRKAARDKSESKADKEAAQRKAEDIARITAELDKYTKGFDVNTEAGRANQEALDNIRDATLKNVTATFDATGSTDKATEAMKRGRDAFIKAATAAGMAKDEAAKLADNLGLVPKDVTILVKQSGATAAQDAIDQAARDRTALITVKTRIADFKAKQADEATSDPVKVRKAQGGAIYGAGTGTSDSIHALLSNGEHVLTAAEVQKLGGQGAVYALRAAINQGRMPRFAQGGAVAGQFAPTRLSTPTSDGFGRGFLTGSLDLGDGLTGRIRAVAQSEESTRSRRGNRVSL